MKLPPELRLEVDSVPEALDEISRRMNKLEIEREAIKRENDKDKLKTLNEEIANFKRRKKRNLKLSGNPKRNWSINKQNKMDIERTLSSRPTVRRERAIMKKSLKYGMQRLRPKNGNQKMLQEKLKTLQGGVAMIKEEVDAEDIADVVSRWTGIPVSRMMQSEKEKLLHLEEERTS